MVSPSPNQVSTVHRNSGSRGILTGARTWNPKVKQIGVSVRPKGKIDHAKDRAAKVIDTTRDMVDDAIHKAKGRAASEVGL
jgi:hypothetical protein